MTMKCQKCNEKFAIILIRQSLNGIDYEFSVCEDCAKLLGLWNTLNFNADFPAGGNLFMPVIFPKLNSADLGVGYNTPDNNANMNGNLKCENCNITIDDIRKNGRVGCSKCYDVFENQLVQLFRRVQSGETHRGRKKAQAAECYEIRVLRDEIFNLQKQIKQAVKIEDYESAAAFKAQIGQKDKMIEKYRQKDEGGDSV